MRIISVCLVLFVALMLRPLCLHADERPMLDRVSSVTISSGKPEQIGNVDVQDHDVEIVSKKPEGGGTRKYFWRLAEKEEIVVTVRLPADAEDIAVRVWMDSTVKKLGEAHLTWNSQPVGDQDKPFVLRAGDVGRNVMNIYLDDPKPENQLKLTGTKGEIDIDAVEFRYRVPCPSWENDKVRMTLLEPAPDQVVDKDSKGEGIELRWTASGPMEQGWIKIEYCEPGKEQWKAVPGAEGISFGSKEWPSKTGSLIWRYDGDLQNLEFRVLFNSGANPLVVRQQEERKAATAAQELRKNLLELKRKSIVEIKTAIDPTLWRRHDTDSHRVATRCLDQVQEEFLKPEANIGVIEQSLANADVAILLAFEKMDAAFTKHEQTEIAAWKDLLSAVELYLKESETLQTASAAATEKTSGAVKQILMAAPVSFATAETVEVLEKIATNIRYKIGRCCYDGRGVKQDHAEAVEWFRVAAEQGDIAAQGMLGGCYFAGEGVTQNFAEGVKYLRMAAEQGDAFAQGMLGSCYREGEGVARDLTEAVKWTRMAAEQGNAFAQVDLGTSYRLGEGVTKDMSEAVKWFRKAAEQGDPRAQGNLGQCYAEGEGVTKNMTEAVKWYSKAAEQGDATGQTMLGTSCAEEGNFTEAVKWFRKAAEQEHTQAQVMLAACYHAGEGVTKDLTEAVKWGRKAAEQGHIGAQSTLGLCYMNGEGVSKDMIEAVKWFRKAAEQDDAASQLILGACYFEGEGVAKDLTEAIKWYRKAAEQENAGAQSALGQCYMTGEGVQEDMTEAVKWFRKAAEQGDAVGQVMLGDCYREGEGVPKDMKEAVEWYRKAAEQGDAAGQVMLGACYAEGEGVVKDMEEAIKWFRKAAEQDHIDAQTILGDCLYNGTGVAKDLREGVKWYLKAAEQKHAGAQRMLGVCYHNGEGVTKDMSEAVKWIRKAAEQGDAAAQVMLGDCYANANGVKGNFAEAARWYRKAAGQGDTEAQKKLTAIQNTLGYVVDSFFD